MGQIHFILPTIPEFDDSALAAVFVMGIEQIPWPSKTTVNNQILTIDRNFSESCHLHIPLRFDTFGELVVSTATLREREEPYFLILELLRGTINRLNSQLFLWQEGGLDLDQQLTKDCNNLNDRLATLIFQYAQLLKTDSSGQTSDVFDEDSLDVHADEPVTDEFDPASLCNEQTEIDQAKLLDTDSFALLKDTISNIHAIAQVFSDFVINLRIEHDGMIRSVLGFIFNGASKDDIPKKLPDWANFACCPIWQLLCATNKRK